MKVDDMQKDCGVWKRPRRIGIACASVAVLSWIGGETILDILDDPMSILDAPICWIDMHIKYDRHIAAFIQPWCVAQARVTRIHLK
jgi:hypothetical protein